MIHLARVRQSGVTFVELIIVSALAVLVFGAIFVSFQTAIELVSMNRAKLSAVSLANDRMEYFRSLPYDDVGTLTGLIRGPVPTNSTLTLNDMTFNERVVVQYVDGVGDGVGGADINGILADYKQIKLEYTWTIGGRTDTISLVSNIMPRAIESDVGGGSIRVEVYDQDLAPLSGARVELINASSTAPIYEDRLTNASGQVLFSGVPADSNYEVIVSGTIAGQTYSVDQTYQATTSNPNPVRAPFAVVEDGLATQTFFIDQVSDITLSAKIDITESSRLDQFADLGSVASTTDTTEVFAGALTLASTSGTYIASGTVFMNPLNPATIEQWEVVRVGAEVPANTSYIVQIYTGNAVTGYTLIPDGDLLNNSSGFADTLVDVSALDPATYPNITVGITLNSTDSATSSRILELETFWRESATELGVQNFLVRGEKTIGTNDDLTPVYKASSTESTDASGELLLSGVEYDTYTFAIDAALDIASACPAHPLPVRGGEDAELELLYVAGDTESVRVVVQDALGRSIPGATVRLYRTGYDETRRTDTCGQAFFVGGDLDPETDYGLEVSAMGYDTDSQTGFSVAGDVVTNIILTP